MKALCFLGVLGLVAGCMGPTFIVQQYPGDVRPRESVAILRVNGKDPVRLLTLDDQDVEAPILEDGRLHIEVLPGRHRLSVKNAANPSEPAEPVVVEAEANRVYRVAYGPAELAEPARSATSPGVPGVTPGLVARIFEVDRDSDRPLRDVTVVAQPAPLPPP